ncbi:MAG: strictosidine synthase family protein, partial [Myxococcaceae bacterium]|nr:strictosidine synthase family protein [Myxococcaceae bacterium]
MKTVLRLLLAAAALAGAALVLAPSPIEPAAWEPPPPTPLEGRYAPNEHLASVEWWARELVGPEAMYVAADGAIVTGLKDGRIVKLRPGSDEATVLADTHGRPLAIAPHPDGRVVICDAFRGLLALSSDGVIEVLASEQGGTPFRFVDDLAITTRGVIYFSDASARYSIDRFTDDLLEHQTTGRVLKYDPSTRATTLVAGGFAFANGVALGPDEAFLV